VCNGPNEDLLYAGGGGYIDANFANLDRIGWVEAGALHGVPASSSLEAVLFCP
jgi:hypothetical protein